jgi:hypothetical protein
MSVHAGVCAFRGVRMPVCGVLYECISMHAASAHLSASLLEDERACEYRQRPSTPCRWPPHGDHMHMCAVLSACASARKLFYMARVTDCYESSTVLFFFGRGGGHLAPPRATAFICTSPTDCGHIHAYTYTLPF